MPAGTGQQPAYDQADERPGDRRDGVAAERHSPLVSREGVGDNRGGVGDEHRAAHALHDPEQDDRQGRGTALGEDERQPEGAHGEDREAQVEQAHPPVVVPETAERDHKHRGDDQEAQQDPQQVTDVRGLQRVEPDATEDGRQ